MPGAPIADVRKVFDHHNKVMSKVLGRTVKWKLTPTLKVKIKLRLKTFTVDEIKLASVNLSQSSWHTGYNPGGKEYCTPTFLFRTDDQINDWMDAVQHRPTSGDGKPDTRAKAKDGKYEGIDNRDE